MADGACNGQGTTGQTDAATIASAHSAELVRLRKINVALMDRVERSIEASGGGFSLFQRAISLESLVRQRTEELTHVLQRLEHSNEELTQAKEHAEQANRSKMQFLAAASHDVLQPLNAAQLLLSSLSMLQTHADGARLCRQVERSLDTMHTLLRTLLFMSRLDTGDVSPTEETVALYPILQSIASDFEPIADQKGLRLRLRAREMYVHSDATMLRRIIQNIVSNAIRYSAVGGVLIGCSRIGSEVHLRVADTGVGIPDAHQQDIYVEFRRISQPVGADSEPDEGLGLGLAIVARMVSMLGLRLRLNSVPGCGSCFHLILNAVEPDYQDPASSHAATSAATQGATLAGTPVALSCMPVSTHRLRGRRVLLVENDLTILRAMQELFQKWGCQTRLAAGTEEALAALDDELWHPDVIVADQHLNDNDLGTITIKRVRERVTEHLPAVIITANPSKRLAKLATEAGIEMMLKPVKPAELRALLSHLNSGS